MGSSSTGGRSGRQSRRAAGVLMVGGLLASLQAAAIVVAPPSRACHEPQRVLVYELQRAHHRVVPASGDLGSSAGSYCLDPPPTEEAAILGGASASAGERVVSEVDHLTAGDAYRIRLASAATTTSTTTKKHATTTTTQPSGTSCAADGTHYEFAGGTGPAFTAEWNVPAAAPKGDYTACVTDASGTVVADTLVPFTVS